MKDTIILTEGETTLELSVFDCDDDEKTLELPIIDYENDESFGYSLFD